MNRKTCADCGYDYSHNVKCACKQPKGGKGHCFSVEVGCVSVSAHFCEDEAVKAGRAEATKASTPSGSTVRVMDYSGPKPRECWYRVKP